MKLYLLVAFVAIAAGCASSSQTYAPDGRVGHSINCSGTARNWGMCLEKAGELCGAKGYDVVSRTGDQGLIASGSQGNFFAGTTISRSMLVVCKP
jgi:hypothetical protein